MRIEAARARALVFGRALWRSIDETRALGVAAETAFWLFLSLIPLAAVTGILAAAFSLDNWEDVAPLLGALPPTAQGLIRKELEALAVWNRGSVGFGSAAVFVWLASSGMHAIFEGLELSVGVSRAWLHRRLLAIGSCLALPIIVLLLGFLGPGFVSTLRQLGLDWLAEPTGFERVISVTTSALVVFAYVLLIYRVGVPRRASRNMPLVPGALSAVALQIVSGLAYGAYVARMGDGSAYVAGLAALGGTMSALYLFSVALLLGAVVNRTLGDARRRAQAA